MSGEEENLPMADEDHRLDTDPAPGVRLDDRNAAGLGEAGDLGAGTPANVDVHNLGQKDRPQEEWGEPAGEAATFSSNHSRKGLHADGDSGQGAKTRKLNKDIISRRT
jgi:hypothetical protein